MNIYKKFLVLFVLMVGTFGIVNQVYALTFYNITQQVPSGGGFTQADGNDGITINWTNQSPSNLFNYAEVSFALTDEMYYGDACASGSGHAQIFVDSDGFTNYGLPSDKFSVIQETIFTYGSATRQILKISLIDDTANLGLYTLHTHIQKTTPAGCTYISLNEDNDVSTPIYLGYTTLWYENGQNYNYEPEISMFSPDNFFPNTVIRFGGSAFSNSVNVSDRIYSFGVYNYPDFSDYTQSSVILDAIDHINTDGIRIHASPDLINNPLNFSGPLHKITDPNWITFYYNGFYSVSSPSDNTHDLGIFSVKCDMCITVTPTPTTITEGLTQTFLVSKYNSEIVNLSTSRIKMYAGDCTNTTCSNPIILGGATGKFAIQSVSSGTGNTGTVVIIANSGKGLVDNEVYTLEIGSNDSNFTNENYYPRAKAKITVNTTPQTINITGSDIVMNVGETTNKVYTANVINISQVDWKSSSDSDGVYLDTSLVNAGVTASRNPASDNTSPFQATLTVTAGSNPVSGTITLYAQDTDGFPAAPPKVINVTINPLLLPDLTALSISPPTTAVTGVAKTFSVTITNIGNASTGTTFPVLWQKASNINGTGTISDIGYDIKGPLGSSATLTATHSITLSGTPSLRVCADKSSASGGGVVSESNETNNCGPWTNITVSSVPVVTLTATSNPVDNYTPSTTLNWYSSGATGCDPISWTNTSGGSGTIAIASLIGSVSSGNLTSATTFSLTCTGPGGSDTDSVTVNIIPTVDLVATPTNIDEGGSSLLTWTTKNASSCTGTGFDPGLMLNNDGTEVPILVSPTVATTYSLSCAGFGTATTPNVVDSVTVNIKPTVDLTANPTNIMSGASTLLAWNSTNATSCSANWTTSTATSGTKILYPTVNTTYSLTCTGPGGSTTDSVRVTIVPTVNLTANPTNIISGQSSTLDWTAYNATTCTGTGFDTGGRTSSETGSVIVSPVSTTTYSIDCTGEGGIGSDSVTVTVGGFGIGMSGSISTTPTYCQILVGASTCSVNFSWNVINPENPGGSAVTSPSYPLGMGALFTNVDSGLNVPHIVPFGLSTYYLYNNAKLLDQTGVNASCVNDAIWNGTICVALPTVTLTANPNGNPPNPPLPYGSSTTLTWVTNNATYCTASSNPVNNSWNGAKPSANGSHSGTLVVNGTTDFNIFCSNSYGSANASVTVTQNPPPSMSGTLTPASSTCEIASLASTCSNTLTWTTTNPQGTSAVTSKTGTPSPVNGNNGSQLFTVHSVGDTFFFLYNNGVELAQAVINAKCVADNYWDGTKCIVPLGYPTVTISASPNPIDSGQSSDLTWSSTDADTCVASDDWSGTKALSGTKNTGPLTSSKTYSLTCSNSIGMDFASVTVEVNSLEMTGTLSVSPDSCIIPVGQSNCSSKITWNVKNPENPGGSAVTSNKNDEGVVTNNFIVYENLDTGKDEPVVLTYPFRTFFLYNNGVKLNEVTTTASCDSSVSSWDGTKCVYFSPTVTLTANPKSVIPGGSSTLSWTSTHAISCDATGGWVQTNIGTSGSHDTGSLQTTTAYSITCLGYGSQASGSATVTVRTTTTDKQPIFEED